MPEGLGACTFLWGRQMRAALWSALLSTAVLVNPWSAAVVHAACGDGVLEDGEQCDDGNLEASDGCDAQCAVDRDFVRFCSLGGDGALVTDQPAIVNTYFPAGQDQAAARGQPLDPCRCS